MRILLSFQLLLCLVGTALAWFLVAPMAGWSFAAGSGTTLLNLCVLVFGWPRILARKQVAIGTVAIVIKFAILGWILYLVAHSPTVSLGWFAMGMGTVLPSVLVSAFTMPVDSEDESTTEFNAVKAPHAPTDSAPEGT